MRSPSPTTRAGHASIWLCALALVIAGGWVYSTSFGGVMLLDDIQAIARNSSIKTLSPIAQITGPPREATVAGRPVANFSLALNYALAPPDARDAFPSVGHAAPPGVADRITRNVWGYHLMNLLIHVAAALALFGIVRRTLVSDRLRARCGAAATPLAFAVALVWLVHPLQTESVTYIIQRVESLMGLFYLLTMYCAIRAADDTRAPWWTMGAIVACALGMATKQVMVSAPVMVVLWDIVFGARLDNAARPPGRRRWVLYAGLAATWIILAALVRLAPREHSVGTGLDHWTAWTYLLTQTQVVTHYLRLAIVPSPLVFLYAWPRVDALRAVALPAAFLSGLAVLTVIGLARRHPLGFAGAWVFLILAPTSSVLPIVTEVAAEHRMYLPLAAIVASVVVGAYVLGDTFLPPRLSRAVARARVGAVLVIAIVAILGSESYARNRDYWSDAQIWRDTIAKQPMNARAHVGYAIDLAVAGRYAEAEPHLQLAVRLDEASPLAQGTLGAVQVGLGRYDDAVPHLERALTIWPDYTDAHRNLGEIYARRRQDALAVVHLTRVVAVQPDDPQLLDRLAQIYATSADAAVRDDAKALALAEEAVRLTSRRDPALLGDLAAAQAGVGRFPEAAVTATEALSLARAQGQQALVPSLEARLQFFRTHQRF